MNRTIHWLFILICTAASLFADGFSSLKMGSDARTTALGLAGTALAEGAAAPFWNPASAALTGRRNVNFSLHRWLDDVQSEFAGISAGNGNQGIGFHLLFTEIGSIEYRRQPSDTPYGTFSAHELKLGLAYARRIMPRLYAGLSVNGYYEKLFSEDAWGLGGDFGLLYRTPWRDLKLAAVIQNMGKTGRFRDESIPLPLTGRAGLLLPFTLLEGEWNAVCDAVKEEGFPVHLHSGIEYGWHSLVAFRIGIMTGYESRDVTCGLGFTRGSTRLDYSYMPMPSLGNSHRFSFGFTW
jgi:hypothetical protein